MTIRRVWRGWATTANASKYQETLLTRVIPGIEAKQIPGFRSIEVLREDLDGEVEFSTIMTFDSLENVKAFQGEDYARCYVPAEAQSVLSRWDETARHYDVIERRSYD